MTLAAWRIGARSHGSNGTPALSMHRMWLSIRMSISPKMWELSLLPCERALTEI
jgi:hypothetical protein